MTKFQAFWRSFHKNVIVKRKYKAFWYLLTDPEYKASINRLFELTKGAVGKESRFVPVSMIVPGHKIVYHSYAIGLIGKTDIPNIRVIWDEEVKKWRVVDGNHRLLALTLEALKGNGYIYCEVLLT